MPCVFGRNLVRSWSPLLALPVLGFAFACSAQPPASSGASGGAPGSGGSTAGTRGGAGASLGGTTGVGGTLTTSGGNSSGGSAESGASSGGASSGAGNGGSASGGTSSGGSGNGGGGSASLGGSSANTSGASGSSSGSGGGTGTGFLKEDFESGSVGTQPSGWDNFIAWNKNGQNPSGDTLALIDSARAHSGTKAMHFKGGGNPAMITRALPSGTNKLYVRAWFYLSRQLGMNPGANHETLIGIRKATGSANDEVRFGEIKGVIGTNEVPTDNISPKMDAWGKGPVVPANVWTCIEVAFLGDQAQHQLRAWADGTLVHEITAADQWQNGVMPATWLDGKFVEVILGWHSFSNANVELWMDDLVLSTSAIGCN